MPQGKDNYSSNPWAHGYGKDRANSPRGERLREIDVHVLPRKYRTEGCGYGKNKSEKGVN